VDNIKLDLHEVRLKGVERIHLAQDRDQWLALVRMEVILYLSSIK
jgi:hypothetical protein